MAVSPKVLVLAPYPVAQPRHGGQLRVHHILQAYRALGLSVDFTAVFQRGHYPNATSHDLLLPEALSASLDTRYDAPLADHLGGMHAAGDPALCAALARRISQGGYDVIQLEHPFLWPLLARALSTLTGQRPRVVYSSHNVEYPMKGDVLRRLEAPEPVIARAEAEICAVETELARTADLVWAVSDADASRLRELGQRTDGVHVFGNGVGLPDIAPARAVQWGRKHLPTRPFATFISSYHLPNAVGFFAMLSDSMAFLPPDAQLVIAGGICNYLTEAPEFMRWRDINLSRTRLLGVVEDVGIAALRQQAHVFVLPIVSGGGSNIKTAEALISGHYVLCTSTAMRGFDAYAQAPGVFVEDDPVRFRARLAELLYQPALTLSPQDQELRRQLLWEHTLAGMGEALMQRHALTGASR